MPPQRFAQDSAFSAGQNQMWEKVEKMRKEDYSKPLALKNVRITDAFWGRVQEVVRTEVIPYQWEALNDRIPEAAPSYCMRNFRVAGRLMKEKREKGSGFTAPSYTFRGFEALPEDPENPDPEKFYGFVFQDSDFAKWIEAVGYTLTNHPDPELERIADGAIDIVCAAQAENGYLDTYYIINGMDRIFTNLRDHHELYCFGHLAEGAVSYYRATGKDKLLRAVERYADFIVSRFGPEEGKCKGYPGHEIAEMALARLYELTGERRYLELAGFFLDERGSKPCYFEIEEKERAGHEGIPYRKPGDEQRFMYHQAHMPVREQTEAVGHAVRAVYLYSGMADVARLTGDEGLFAACERLFRNITDEKLYITGGIGGTHIGEAFSYPYDLPNDTAYSETCAAIGLAFFARRMLQIRADSRYSDCMELALYNTVLAGMALDGKSFFYVNPLEVEPLGCKKDERRRHVKPVRQKWFGCACCPPNIARIVSSLGAYAYTQSESTLYTHLYVGSDIHVKLNGTEVDFELESSFPWEGDVKAMLHVAGTKWEDRTCCGTLAFRIPGWCRSVEAEMRRKGRTEKDTDHTLISCRMVRRKGRDTGKADAGNEGSGFHSGGDFEMVTSAVSQEELSGECVKEKNPIGISISEGYLYMTGCWHDGDEIYLSFPMEVRCIQANAKVRENIGKVAFVRGPVCYCMEETDNGGELQLLRADGKKLSEAMAEASDELGHEMRILKVPGFRQKAWDSGAPLYRDYTSEEETEVMLKFVPYYAWNNRGEGEMSVWVRV